LLLAQVGSSKDSDAQNLARFGQYLAEIGIEDAGDVLAQLEAEMPADMVMKAIADPKIYDVLGELAVDHYSHEVNGDDENALF